MPVTIPTLEDDPCGRATALKKVRDDLVVGRVAVEVEQQAGNGQRRRAKFALADLSRLDREIAQADGACSVSTGGPRRGFVLGGYS